MSGGSTTSTVPTTLMAGRVQNPMVVAGNLEVPWGVAFLPSGEALVAERRGRIQLVPTIGGRTTFEVPGVDQQGEGGLLGLAVSPTYAEDRWVYAYFTTAADNRISRFRLDTANRRLTDQQVILEGIDKSSTHNGGRIAFGPDGMLYAGTGDAGERAASQNRESLNGKILRMTPDGRPAPNNPFPDSVVYSLGHRNVQGLGWDDEGRLYATEFGQNRTDEVNRIEAGGNYGWPTVEGAGGGERFIDPIVTWSPREASPSGMAVVTENGQQALYVAALRGQRLWRVPLDGNGGAGEPEALLGGQFGRLRTAVVAPDGSLWVTTSNQDSYGDASLGPDRVVRLSPATGEATRG